MVKQVNAGTVHGCSLGQSMAQGSQAPRQRPRPGDWLRDGLAGSYERGSRAPEVPGVVVS